MDTAVNFTNEGLIDLRAIKTFGVSVKEKEGAIGYFGTGLKYAIAVLLREGQTITLWQGMEKYTFEAKETEIRNKQFSVITMNGEELAFTTELGKDWELWQAFRELYCNCADESGELSCGPTKPQSGKTLIVVSGEAFHKTYLQRDTVILENRNLVTVGPGVDVYQGTSQYIYYQGVRAAKLQSASKYTYNITMKLSLTEDRTIRYMFEVDNILANLVMQLKEKQLIQEMVTTGKGYMEGQLDFDSVHLKRIDPTPEFLDTVQELRTSELYPVLNPTAVTLLRSRGHLYIEPQATTNLNAVQNMQLSKAVHVCREMGFTEVGGKYPITVTDELPNNILGLAENGNIYIAQRTFLMGTKMVTSTLLEEYLHLEKNLADESREMQNYLFDLVLTLQEQVMGEPV